VKVSRLLVCTTNVFVETQEGVPLGRDSTEMVDILLKHRRAKVNLSAVHHRTRSNTVAKFRSPNSTIATSIVTVITEVAFEIGLFPGRKMHADNGLAQVAPYTDAMLPAKRRCIDSRPRHSEILVEAKGEPALEEKRKKTQPMNVPNPFER